MKLIELESSLTPLICTHFWFVYVMRSLALNPPDHLLAAEVLGSMLTGVPFIARRFCFHMVKACDTNIAIYVYVVKTSVGLIDTGRFKYKL